MTPAPSPRRLFLLVLLGALAMQTAWILALPAFRGSDEFDHVFRAEAVAHGQLLDDGAPRHGRGGLVKVPGDVVAAAADMCASYAYTGHDNCNPVAHLGSGTVTVASAASRYNPTYYAVVGVMARPFHGAASVFAMRAFTAVLAALLLSWAAVVTARWARNAWPLLGLLVTATPVLIYSTAVAAPNGVGYAAGCLLWAAGLGLVEERGRPHVAALTTAALTVMVTHTTGVLWMACIAAVIASLQPLGSWREVFHRSPRRLIGAALLIGAGGLACVAWIVLAKTNALREPTGSFQPLTFDYLASGQVVWALQTIAAFPLRNDPAPVIVYLLWLAPFLGLLVTGFKTSSARLRLGSLLLLAFWVAVPMALTLVAYAAEGLAWQGRYALPLAAGLPALAGLALSRYAPGPRQVTFVLTVILCASAQVISCARVASLEADKGLAPTFAANAPGAIVLIAALAVTGAMIPLLLVRSRSGAQLSTPHRATAVVH